MLLEEKLASTTSPTKPETLEVIVKPSRNGGKVILIDGIRARKPRSNVAGLREVYFTRDYVIKFDGNDSYGQNVTEANTLREINPEDRKYFPRLVAMDSECAWIVVTRIRNMRRPDDVPKEIASKVKKLCNKYEIGDIHPDYCINWVSSVVSP